MPRSELATMVRLHRRDGRRRSTCRSARSATWGTATCIRRSSPTSATTDEMHRVHQALEAIVEADAGARRHDHRGARRRARQETVAAPADGRRQLRSDASDQADARPAQPAEPRQNFRLIAMQLTLKTDRLLGPPAVHALRHVSADLPDLRRDRARAEQPARADCADAGDRRRRSRRFAPAFADEMSYCLGCLACQTACPAGVNYAALFETARSDIRQPERRSAA